MKDCVFSMNHRQELSQAEDVICSPSRGQITALLINKATTHDTGRCMDSWFHSYMVKHFSLGISVSFHTFSLLLYYETKNRERYKAFFCRSFYILYLKMKCSMKFTLCPNVKLDQVKAVSALLARKSSLKWPKRSPLSLEKITIGLVPQLSSQWFYYPLI